MVPRRRCRSDSLHKSKQSVGGAHPTFQIKFVSDRYTLRLHRRLRGIAGFRVATLPGLEHTLAVHCGFWVNRAWQVLHDEAYV
jgi:hypothetical protein